MAHHAPGMRERFFDSLIQKFEEDPKLILVSADDGGPGALEIFKRFPNRAVTVGIAEQQMIGFSAGLALEGFKPVALSIAPFATLRCLEFIKLDLCAMDLPVIIVGVGAGYSYDIAGPTHHTVEDISALRVFPNIEIYSPCDGVTASRLPGLVVNSPHPKYVRIDRGLSPDVYAEIDPSKGYAVPRKGKDSGNDAAIIATGRTVFEALRVAQNLQNAEISCVVIDVFRLKPFPKPQILTELIKRLKTGGFVVTYEEHQLNGGLGSIMAEALMDFGSEFRMLRIGQDGNFAFDLGGRDVIWQIYGLDAESATRKILHWLGKEQLMPVTVQNAIEPSKATGY